MVKTHKVKYIHFKRGSKRNILGYIALVYISVNTKIGTQQSGHRNTDQFPFLLGISFGHGWS